MKLNKNSTIVYISNSTLFDNSANSTHVAKMSSAFAKLGYKTILYTHKNKETVKNAYEYYDLNETLAFKYYIFSTSHRRLAMLLVSLIEAIIIYYKSGISTLYFGRNLLVLYFLKIFFKSDVICEVHALPNTKNWSRMLKSILNKIDYIVVISDALKGDLMDLYGVSSNKFIVLPDAADVVELEVINKNELNRFCIGYVGGFYRGRGTELILELSNKLPKIDFVMVGSVDENTKKYTDLNVNNNLEIIKYQSHSSLKEIYKRFDLVIAPYSKKIYTRGNEDTSRWASPLKLFEYMSHKKCMLVSDIPVFREVLVDQFNCILCIPDDLDDWINKIKTVLSDENLRYRIANNAHSDFLKNYTWDGRASKLIAFIIKY
jgi:glycosyltransferase involved in cell wall biosynthesis